jgi:hypothetical protein
VNERPSRAIEGLPAPLSELPWSADFVMQTLEILPVTNRRGELLSFRPCHADSFIIGWPAGEHPQEVATKALDKLRLRPRVLHSTSWRQAGAEVVMTYLAVVPPTSRPPESWEEQTISHTEIARGGAIEPPPVIGVEQVLEHALRHLAWLVNEDEEIARNLPEWREVLKGYVPEPFRAFGVPA